MTKFSRSIIFLLFFITTSSFIPKGKIIQADKTLSSIQYSVNHPLHSATAVSDDFICNIDYNVDLHQVDKVGVAIKVSTFDSKNSNRDSNAMEAVEALKYPYVKFISSSVTSSPGKLEIMGDLTFHGIANEIFFIAEQKTEADKLTVQGSFTISLDAFKVERPGLLGMKIDDEVKVEFTAVFII